MTFCRLITFLALLAAAANLHAQSTEFTYQGRLLSGNAPANGTHDFEFVLWDSVSGGNQLGPVVTLTAVNVNNGVFSVRIDFGDQFPGASRFLEIKVRQAGSSEPFNTLAPRQSISSAPYAIKSLNAENASTSQTAINASQLGGVPSGQFVITGDPRLTDARKPLPNSPDYIQNSTAQQSTSNFNISGTGKAAAFDSATGYHIGGSRILGLVSGTQNFFAGPSAGLQLTTGNFNSFFGFGSGSSSTTGGSNSFFGNLAGNANTSGSFNSFFGDGAGVANGTASSNAFFGALAGLSNNVGGGNSFFGEQAGRANTSGAFNTFVGRLAGSATSNGSNNTFVGVQAGVTNVGGTSNTLIGATANVGHTGLINATAIGANAVVTQSHSLVLGGVPGVNGALGHTRVGIGTTAPSSKLTVAGTGAYNLLGAARFDLLNTATGVGYLQHVDNAGLWQLATTEGDSRIVVNHLGDTGVGITTPVARLHVASASSSVNIPIAVLQSSGSQVPLAFRLPGLDAARIRADHLGNLVLATVGGPDRDIHLRAGDDAETDILVDGNSGRVGIGTAFPFAKLHVNGTGMIGSDLTVGGQSPAAATLDVLGTIRFASLGGGGSLELCRSATNFIAQCSSSARYKSNITNFKSGLGLLNQLRPVGYNWKTDNAPDIGLVAEEVAGIEPRLITRNASGGVEGVKYDRLTVVLINAVKEQQAEIEVLRQQDQQNKQRLKELNDELEKQQTVTDALRRVICNSNPGEAVCKEERR